MTDGRADRAADRGHPRTVRGAVTSCCHRPPLRTVISSHCVAKQSSISDMQAGVMTRRRPIARPHCLRPARRPGPETVRRRTPGPETMRRRTPRRARLAVSRTDWLADTALHAAAGTARCGGGQLRRRAGNGRVRCAGQNGRPAAGPADTPRG